MITYRGQQTPRRSLAMPLTRLYYMEKSGSHAMSTYPWSKEVV